MSFTIDLKILTRFSQFKDFREFIGTNYFVCLASAPACRNVLEAFGREDDRVAVAANACAHVIDKTFDIELPKDKLLSTFVAADHAPSLRGFLLLGSLAVDHRPSGSEHSDIYRSARIGTHVRSLMRRVDGFQFLPIFRRET